MRVLVDKGVHRSHGVRATGGLDLDYISPVIAEDSNSGWSCDHPGELNNFQPLER